ncbi:hypothetical protein BDW59DRAFT_161116 [Aspergillus cavernicola]|uniref:Uncharacterized protein n=1 Tax=Aspergillus cavernicola TaxID=176166 RepID=A0ABR4IEW3_9EURO
MTPPVFPLDAWWPRKRAEWPGPRAPSSPDNCKFPKGFPEKESVAIIRTYAKAVRELNKAIRIPLTDGDQNRLLAEQRNGEDQESRWQYCILDEDLGNLDLDAVHDFCWKICAVYMLLPENYREDGIYIYHFLDSKWFQGVKPPAFCGSFIAKGIHLTAFREPLEIMELHRRVCDQVTSRQRILSEQDVAEHGEKDAKRAGMKNTFWSHADYHLLPIFRRFFIVLDVLEKPEEDWQDVIDWADQPAQLVFTQDHTERLAIDPIDVEQLGVHCDVQAEGNTVTGKLGSLVDIILELWAKEKATPSTLNSVAEELDGRLRYIRQDERQSIAGSQAGA